MKKTSLLPNLRASGSKRMLFLAVLLIFLAGCQLVSAPTAGPTAQPSQPPAPTQAPASTTEAAPTPEAAPTVETLPTVPVAAPTEPGVTSAHPTDVPEPAPIPLPPGLDLAGKLTGGGPWLVIHTSAGLYAVNEDGSGLTRLTTESADGEQTLSLEASPDGRSFAYITGKADRIHALKLNLMMLPEGKTTLVTALTNKNSEPGADAVMDAKVDAVRAITDVKSLAWSPDGKTLAFIGVQQGASADLYTYTLASGKINRLTDGPSQAYGPNWSPDGRYVVQYGVSSFGTGAGYSMAGVWAARSDGSAVIDLGKPGGSGEELVGWLDGDSFVTHSWTPVCGPENLRIININDKSQTRLVRGCFGGAAMAANGAIMVVGSADMGSELSGIHLIGPDNLERQQLSKADAYRVTLIPDSGEFLVDTPVGGQVYSSGGQLMAAMPQTTCAYGMQVGTFGMIYGWTCGTDQGGNMPGVWINGPGLTETRIFNQPAHTPTMGWENMLLYFSGSTLYRAAFFSYIPQPVAEVEGDVQAVMWVRKWE